MWVIGLVIQGFIVGGLARWAVPGPDPMPWYATIGLGIGGNVVGGLVAQAVFGIYGTFVFALAAAVLLLVLYRVVVQKRPLTGPRSRGR